MPEETTTTTEPPVADPASLVGQTPPVETPPAPPVEAKPPAPVTEFVPLTAADIKFPEGMTVSDGQSKSFLEVLNNREMTPAQQAQALVDLQAQVAKEASETGSQAWTNLQTEWVNEVKADKDIGGANLTPALESIGKLVDQFGTPELRAVMDLTGAGNNVHVIKFLNNISKQLTEGGAVFGAPPTTEQSVADLLYPTMKKGS